MRYSAFISYSHADRSWATWLHRRLESYRLPKRVRGRPGPFGPIAARLPPVFRDRDELRAGPDLAGSLATALADAETLIVVCSPHSAGSRWVNEEIREFVRLGRADRILCLIVGGGDPGSHFPSALLEGDRAEPLAADVRRNQDGREHALLKLVAAILGLDYDELRQREAVRRHRQLMAIAASSVVGLLFTSSLAVFALISRNEAIAQRNIAEQRTLTAERTVEFVKSMFRASDPTQAQGADLSAKALLERGARQIQSGLDNEPAVKAELGVTLGEVFLSLGLYDRGDQLIRQSMGIKHGQDAVTADQLVALAEDEAKQGHDPAAIAADQAAIRLAQRSNAIGAAVRSRMYEQLSEVQSDSGQRAAAEQSAAAALSIDRARAPTDPSDIARDLEALGDNELALFEWSPARQRFQEALALRQAAEGANSPSVADDLNALANIAFAQGDLATAETDYGRVATIDEKVFAPDHPDVAVALNGLGLVMVTRREFAGALPQLARAVAINEQQRSADNPDMAFVLTNLGLAERGVGRTTDASASLQKALAIARRTHHRMLAPILSTLAEIRCDAGDTAAGEAMLKEARPIMAADYRGIAWRSAWVDNVEGACLLRAGDRAGARRLIEASSPVVLAQWRPDTLYGHAALVRLQSVRNGG